MPNGELTKKIIHIRRCMPIQPIYGSIPHTVVGFRGNSLLKLDFENSVNRIRKNEKKSDFKLLRMPDGFFAVATKLCPPRFWPGFRQCKYLASITFLIQTDYGMYLYLIVTVWYALALYQARLGSICGLWLDPWRYATDAYQTGTIRCKYISQPVRVQASSLIAKKKKKRLTSSPGIGNRAYTDGGTLLSTPFLSSETLVRGISRILHGREYIYYRLFVC